MMTINPLYIVAGVVSIGLGALVYFKGKSEFEAFKAHVWTPHGIAIAIVWALGFSGIMATLMFVNVQVLGNDLVLETPSQSAIKQRLGK